MRKILILAAFAFGAVATAPAQASEALPPAMAQQLAGQPAEYTMSAAAQRRHMMIEETMRQQRRDQRRGYDRGRPGPRYGYDRGYGPRPGYGRGYGPPPGYGYRRY